MVISLFSMVEKGTGRGKGEGEKDLPFLLFRQLFLLQVQRSNLSVQCETFGLHRFEIGNGEAFGFAVLQVCKWGRDE